MSVFDLTEYNDERIEGIIIPDVGYSRSDKSLLFDGAQSQYLSRTPSVAGNRKTWTFNTSLKRISIGSVQTIFKVGSSAYVYMYFDASDRLCFNINTGSVSSLKITNAQYRDLNATYHITAWCDTTNPTALDRMGLIVNGEEITSFQTNSVDFSQNYDTEVNNTITHYIGSNSAINQYTNSVMSQCYFTDGYKLLSTQTGIHNEYGVWITKPYNGPYGTNGFKLKFNDNISVSTLGKDSSGKGNDWTVVNFTTDSQLDDTWSDNYCTLNPIDLSIGATPTLSNGALTVTYASNSGYPNAGATFSPMGRKGYFEVTVGATSNFTVGFLANTQVRSNSAYTVDASVRFPQDGTLYKGLTTIQSGYLSAVSAGETLGFAFDFTGANRNVWVRNSTGWG